MVFEFVPITLAQVHTMASWWYPTGRVERLDMHHYLDHYRQHGTLIGPGGCQGFAAFHQDQLAGLFEYSFPKGIMEIGLALAPDFKGQGYGTTYVNQGIAFGIRQYSYTETVIKLTVEPWNEAAIRVYEKAGFTLVDQDEKELEMRKSLL